MRLIDSAIGKHRVKSCNTNIVYIKNGWYQLLLRERPERVIFFKWSDYIKGGKRIPTKELSIL